MWQKVAVFTLLLFVLPLPAYALEWEVVEKDDYAKLQSGEEEFYLGCSPYGTVSIEYANAKETSCDEEEGLCGHKLYSYYQEGKDPKVLLTLDDRVIQLVVDGSDAPTISLGRVKIEEYKSAEDAGMLGSFMRTRNVKLEFPAVPRTVTFNNITNSHVLQGFFESCKKMVLEEQEKKTNK